MMRLTLLVAILAMTMGTVLGQEDAAEEKRGEPETSRRWMSRDGKEAWSGKFWKIEKGILEICGDDPKKPEQVPLSKLHAQDLTYLLNMDRRVVRPTFQVARAGYVWDIAREKLIPRSKNMRLVSGTVSSVVSYDLFIVEDGDKRYAVQNYGKKVKKGRDFEAALMPTSKTKFDLGDGKKAYICKAYGAITNQKAFREQLRTNPQNYYKVLTGTSHAYTAWLAGQRKVERVRENAEQRKEVAKENAKTRKEEKEAKAKAREEEDTEASKKKLQSKLKDHQARLKKFERRLLEEERKKKRMRRFTSQYNEVKRRIDAIKKEISYENKMIKSLEEEVEALEK